jgi:hypothetical protein
MIHTHYWNKSTLPQGVDSGSTAWALKILRKALDLDSRIWLREAEPD